MDFIDARHSARMSIKEVSDYLSISLRTVQRYERSHKAPKAVIECLLMIGGYCPSFSRKNDFTGWSFGNGYLWTPEGDRFTSGDVRAGHLASLEADRQYRHDTNRRKQIKLLKTTNVIPFPTVKRRAVS